MNILILRILFKIASQKNIPTEIIISIFKILLLDNLNYHTNIIQYKCIGYEYSESNVFQYIVNSCIPIYYGTEWVIKKYNKYENDILWTLEKPQYWILDLPCTSRKHCYVRGILLSQIRILGEKDYLLSEIIDAEGIITDFKEASLKMKLKYLNSTVLNESLSDYIDFKGLGEYGDTGGWPKLIIEPCGDSRYL